MLAQDRFWRKACAWRMPDSRARVRGAAPPTGQKSLGKEGGGLEEGGRPFLQKGPSSLLQVSLPFSPSKKSDMDNKKVIVLTTGGTIAMKLDPAHGIVPAVSGEDLVASVPGLREACPIEVTEFSNIPSPHMTPKRMFELGNKVEELLRHEDILGVVITHGTDTLEETAYLLDLVHNSEKPVCLTGAMRSAAEISPDGPVNLLCAVRTAASSEARGKGVLVVMNEEIHAAREVVKSHSANTETFVSPFWGPLGYVDPDRVVFRRNTLGRQSIRPPELVEDVHLIKLASGSDSLLIDFLVERNVRGLVLEAFGRGAARRIAGHPPCRGERDSGGHHHPDHSRARARRVRLRGRG